MIPCTLKNFEDLNVTNIDHLKTDFNLRLCPGNQLNDSNYVV